MKVYEVECRAVITIAEEDMQKAALHCETVIKDNPHLISVTGVHEMNFEPAWEESSPKNSQGDATSALSAGAVGETATAAGICGSDDNGEFLGNDSSSGLIR